MSRSIRDDIDGLRGVSVLAVLVFHLWPEQLRGGFTGVDVFFVISGFLITGQLRAELEADRFRPLAFYARRVRRLFPALLTVLVCTLVLGSGFLLDDEWRALGRHAADGVLSFTNIQLWREGGYFDGPSAFKPLRHLWSLGVEEQFYLLWPAMLWLGSRSTRSRLMLFLTAFAAVSFIVNLQLSFEAPSAAFYLPFGRLWEPAAGGLLTFVTVPARLRTPLAVAGVAALIFSFTSILEFDFPSVPVLVPVFAAAALISSGGDGGPVARALAWSPLNAVGRISYPLYLWHWPLLVFARIVSNPGLEQANPRLPLTTSLAIVVASFGLAWLTWQFIERPVRERRLAPVRALVFAGAAVLCAGLAIGSGQLPLPATDPRVALFRAALRDPLMPADGWQQEPGPSPFLRSMLDSRTPQVAFIGDSAMAQYATTILSRSRASPSRPLVVYTAPGCSLIFELDEPRCAGAPLVARRLAEAPGLQTVVLTNQWFIYLANSRFLSGSAPLDAESKRSHAQLADFEAWLTHLAATRRVVVLLTAPVGADLSPRRLMHRSWWHAVRFDDSPLSRAMLEARSHEANATISALAHRAGAEVIDPFDSLCDLDVCARSLPNGQPIYLDGLHVRPQALAGRFRALDSVISL